MSSTIDPAALRALAASPPSDPATRKALHDAARSLVFATESLSDTETRTQNSFTFLPIVKVALDLDLFNILSDAEKPLHIDDLASKTGADARLLHRLLRYLASQRLIAETDVATYTASPTTAHVQPSGYKAGVMHNSAWVASSLAAFPGWLQKNGYRTPIDRKDCAFQDAIGTDLDAFGYLGAHPDKAAHTFEYMAWQKVRSGDWTDGSVKVVEEFRLSDEEVKNGRPLFVDVGGGGGHQCFAFRRAFPERKGKLVLQDTALMIQMVDKEAAAQIDLEPMVHDFLTPQTVKGAKVYYMRTVLHDWNDEMAIKILTQLAGALADDSMVVIDEVVIPAKGATEKQMLYDMVMLSVMGALERSEKQWRNVLEAAGLKLREVTVYDEGLGNALIIAVKA